MPDPVEHAILTALGPGAQPVPCTTAGQPRRAWVQRYPQTHANSPFVRPTSRAWPTVEQHWRALHDLDVRLFTGAGVFRLPTGQFVDGVEVDPADPDAAMTGVDSYDTVYALAGVSTLDVIEFARVGEQNATPPGEWDVSEQILAHMPPAAAARMRAQLAAEAAQPRPAWRRTRDAMEAAMRACPFAILSANEAWLEARLLRPATAPEAAEIARLCLDAAPETFELACDELESDGRPIPGMAEAPDVPDGEAALRQIILDEGRFFMWWD